MSKKSEKDDINQASEGSCGRRGAGPGTGEERGAKVKDKEKNKYNNTCPKRNNILKGPWPKTLP